MNNLHLAIIAAFIMALMLFITGDYGKDMSHFQTTISQRKDFQAYEEKPMLPETIFKEVKP